MAPQNKHGRFLPSETEKNINTYKKLSKKEELHILKYLNDIYGIDKEALKKYEFLKKKDDVWVTTKKAINLIPFTKIGLKINTIGFRAIRNTFQTNPKITTNFAQLLANEIKKNVREITKEELIQYIKGYALELKDDSLKNYCVIKYKDKVIGVGLVKDNTIKNQIPKGRVLINFSD